MVERLPSSGKRDRGTQPRSDDGGVCGRAAALGDEGLGFRAWLEGEAAGLWRERDMTFEGR